MHIDVYRTSFAHLFFPLCFIRVDGERSTCLGGSLAKKYLGSYMKQFPHSKTKNPEWDVLGRCWNSENELIDSVHM